MTRSKGRLTLLVEKSERPNPLRIARDRSVLAARNSSVFTPRSTPLGCSSPSLASA